MFGQIPIMVGHAQQPLADALVFFALGLVNQLCGALEKRFRIDHDKLQIGFSPDNNEQSQAQFPHDLMTMSESHAAYRRWVSQLNAMPPLIAIVCPVM
jgi:hypothetical protein